MLLSGELKGFSLILSTPKDSNLAPWAKPSAHPQDWQTLMKSSDMLISSPIVPDITRNPYYCSLWLRKEYVLSVTPWYYQMVEYDQTLGALKQKGNHSKKTETKCVQHLYNTLMQLECAKIIRCWMDILKTSFEKQFRWWHAMYRNYSKTMASANKMKMMTNFNQPSWPSVSFVGFRRWVGRLPKTIVKDWGLVLF